MEGAVRWPGDELGSPVSRRSLMVWLAAMGGGVAFEADRAQVGAWCSLQSLDFPDHRVRHRNDLGDITSIVLPQDRVDSAFRLVPWLADPSAGSFESVNFPGHFLRHWSFQPFIERFDGDLFRRDATFTIVPRS